MNHARSEALSPAVRAGPIKVFLADDHDITLWGLQRLIESAAHMQVIGTAQSRSELLNHDAAAQADVIVLDLDLAGEDAVEALTSLRQRCAGQVLILTAALDIEHHRAAVMKGARGVVNKSEPAETILQAIEKVHNGEIWLHRAMLGEVLNLLTGGNNAAARRPANPDAGRIASLTPRERDIVRVMVNNPGAKQFAIADELGMSEHTLRNHLTTIYSKLQVNGRLELHVYATEHGLGAQGWDGGEP